MSQLLINAFLYLWGSLQGVRGIYPYLKFCFKHWGGGYIPVSILLLVLNAVFGIVLVTIRVSVSLIMLFVNISPVLNL